MSSCHPSFYFFLFLKIKKTCCLLIQISALRVVVRKSDFGFLDPINHNLFLPKNTCKHSSKTKQTNL